MHRWSTAIFCWPGFLKRLKSSSIQRVIIGEIKRTKILYSYLKVLLCCFATCWTIFVLYFNKCQTLCYTKQDELLIFMIVTLVERYWFLWRNITTQITCIAFIHMAYLLLTVPHRLCHLKITNIIYFIQQWPLTNKYIHYS